MPLKFARFSFLVALFTAAGLTTVVLAQNRPPRTPDAETSSSTDAAAEAPLAAARATNATLELRRFSGEVRIKSIVAPGTVVKEGDVLAELAAPDLEKNLQTATEQLEAAQWSLKSLELTVKQAEEKAPARYQAALVELQLAQQELAKFEEGGREDRIANSLMTIEQIKASIADQQEELKQLETLYKGNDLARESQDIVLNRSKRALEQTKERLRLTERGHVRMLKYELPLELHRLKRTVEDRKEEVERQKTRLDAGVLDGPGGELHAALIRARMGLREAQENVAELRRDATALKITAPHGGLAVVGGVEGNDGASQALKVGDRVARNQAVAGVVDTAILRATMRIPVAEAAKGYKIGEQRKVRCAAVEHTANARVSSRAIAAKEGKVAVVLEIDNAAGTLMPGLSVTIAP